MARHNSKFTCPMHPQIVEDEPGKCPLCGMALVPMKKVKSDGGHHDHGSHKSGIADFRKRFFCGVVFNNTHIATF